MALGSTSLSKRRRGFRRRLRDLAEWERRERPGPTVVQEAILLICDEWLIMDTRSRANALGYYKDRLR